MFGWDETLKRILIRPPLVMKRRSISTLELETSSESIRVEIFKQVFTLIKVNENLVRITKLHYG